jgi:methylated-DNA-[protein]-cysteine S-methyltransferase
MNQSQWKIKSKVGDLFLIANEANLLGIYWEKQPVPLLKDLEAKDSVSKILAETQKQIVQYLEGKRSVFELPLVLEGTEFQKKVWKALLKIPYGKTATYGDIARKIGAERAVRAVGLANRLNRYGIVVPCHRVVSASGGLVGYTAGVEVKSRLLEIEQG